jgi:hypothetical protein
MPAKVRDMHRMLVQKLQAEEKEGSRHTRYRISHGNTLLATTVLSRSYSEIDNSLLSAIGKDLSVNREQMDLLLKCPWSRDDYVRHRLGDTSSQA